MTKYVIILVSLLLSSPVFSQIKCHLDYALDTSTVPDSNKCKISVGNLNNRVRKYLILTTVDSFKQQKKMTVPPGYWFYRATIYFSGVGFNNVHEIGTSGDGTYWLTESSLKDSLKPGSIITFDDMELINDKTNAISNFGGLTYIFDIKDAHLPNKDQLEFHNLTNTFYFKGNIYFSGANFPTVYIIHIPTSQSNQYQSIFKKVKAGSSVTFENVIYRNEDGSLSKPFSKTIKVTPELLDKTVIY